jgi:hypothetical protein
VRTRTLRLTALTLAATMLTAGSAALISPTSAQATTGTVQTTSVGLPVDLTSVSAKPFDGFIGLRWVAPPTSASQPRTGYAVYLDGKLYRTVGASEVSTTVGDLLDGGMASWLQNGRSYQLSVRPFNAVGEAPGATVSAIPITSPARPTSVRAVARDRAFAISWAPVTSSAAAPVTGYRVIVEGRRVYQGTATSFTATGLTAGQWYLMVVEAYGPGGTAASQPLYQFAITTPPAQGTVRVAPRTTSLAVTWARTSTLERPVQGYEILLNDRVVAKVSASTSSYTISSLRRNTAYKVTVRPFNTAGRGTARSVSTRTLA